MQSYQNKRQVALNVLNAVAKIAQDGRKPEIVANLQSEAGHLERGELNTVVCGEAKRGKSSLIGAFLEEIGLCPVDAPVATNCATVIRYGEKERIVVHYEQDGKTLWKEISRAEIADFVTEKGNQGNRRKVKLVEISLDNLKLASGLVMVDTPGVGSLNIDHTAVTYETIPYSDAVLFVGSATEPLSEAETDFATERIGKHTHRILYVLAKRDLVDNWEERLREDLDMLEARLGVKPGTIRGVAVSSKRKMQFLLDRDPELLENSGFPEFEVELSALLAEREEILLGRAQAHLLSAISQLRLPWAAEKAGLELASIEELEALERGLQAKVSRAEQLSLNSAAWNSDLQADLRILQTDCVTLLGTQFAELNDALTNYLKISDYVNSPDKLGSMLSVDCGSAFAQVIQTVEARLGETVGRLSEATSLNIDHGSASVKGVEQIKIGGLVQAKNGSWIRTASEVGRSSAIHTMGLTAAGGLAGGMIGGILGVFGGPAGVLAGISLGAELGGVIGGLVGGIFGIKRGIEEQMERNLGLLRQNLAAEARRQLDAAHRTLSNQIQNLLTALGNDIHKDLVRKIQAEMAACKEAVVALERAKRERLTDFTAKLRDLANQLKRLDYLEETIFGVTGTEKSTSSAAA